MTSEPSQFNLKDFEAIVFDYDGVLFDSMAAIARSAVEMCARHGFNIDENYYHEHFSQPWQNFYRRVGIDLKDDELESFSDAYWEIYEKKRLTSSLYPDVPEVLKVLAEKVKLAIVSATREHVIHENLNFYGLSELFGPDIYSLRDHKVKEIKDFYTKYSFAPQKVIVIGDLPSDIEHGREAGTKTGGMVRRSENKARLLNSNPDFIFYGLKDLL